MFLQHAIDAQTLRFDPAHAEALFRSHPLLLTALVEGYWRNRIGPHSPFAAWPQKMIGRIEEEFDSPLGVPARTDWDHLIYAYLIENTRIYDIFFRVLQMYRSGEHLEVPSEEGRRFWRNTECIIFSDPAPTTVWNVTSRVRSDELSQRMLPYSWALGLDLTHAVEIAQAHPYQKPAAANANLMETFETFISEVWRGIVNVRNISGANDTDNQKIATAAQSMHDMLHTRRQHGNLSRGSTGP